MAELRKTVIRDLESDIVYVNGIAGHPISQTNYSGYPNNTEWGSPIQTKFKYFTHRTAHGALVAGDNTIGSIRSTFNLNNANNVVMIGVGIMFEVDDLWNKVFSIIRDGSVKLSQGDASGSRRVGCHIGADTYSAAAENNASTPACVNFWTFDRPGTTNTLTYNLLVTSGGSEPNFYINRTQSDSNTNAYERARSWMCMLEVSGF